MSYVLNNCVESPSLHVLVTSQKTLTHQQAIASQSLLKPHILRDFLCDEIADDMVREDNVPTS